MRKYLRKHLWESILFGTFYDFSEHLLFRVPSAVRLPESCKQPFLMKKYCTNYIKVTLKQICKFPYVLVFILKKRLAFLTQTLLEFYSPVKFVFFLKSRQLFNVLYCFFMFVNKHFANFTVNYSKIFRIENAKFSEY